MPNGQPPPKRQSKQAPITNETQENAHQKNTGAVLAVVIVGVLVLFAALLYFSN
jgi:hypothetical protein